MTNYRLEDLYWQDFEKLVVAVCRRLLGSQVQSFANGPDGGRDAAFNGTAQSFPSAASSWSGQFVIQAKHSSDPSASVSDTAFRKSTVHSEIGQLAKQVATGSCDCYLLFTNRKGPAQQVQTIETTIRQASRVAQVSLITRETLHGYLDEMPDLVRRFRLGQLTKEGHNLPLEGLGDLFVGRDHDLEQLAHLLKQKTVAVTQAVLGTGGIGKTRLALEYAWRHLDNYHYCFFVNAASVDTLNAGIADLVEMLDLPPSDDQMANYNLVIKTLQNQANWLLILDNVDDEAAQTAVKALTPRLQKSGQVLVTSRRQDWPVATQTYNLDQLSESASIAFLERHLGLTDDASAAADIAALAKELCGLPLALELAAAYIQNQRISVAKYLQHWQEDKQKLLAFHHKKWTTYPESLILAWQRSMALISPSAQTLLRLCGHCAAAAIPREMFEAQAEQLTAFILSQQEEAGAVEIDDALVELADISLIQLTAETVVLHPLLVEILRSDTKQDHLLCAMQWVKAYAPFDSDDVRTWPIWDPLRPHVASLASQGDAANISEHTSFLMGQLALLLREKSLYSDAESLMRRALTIAETAYGGEHPNVASHLNNLATLLKATNRLADAEPLMRRALAIDEAAYGAEHPNVAIDLNNLAGLLQATNRLADAEPLMRRALAIDEAAYGGEHPNVATDLNNLAQLLQDTNRLADAEPMMRRALAIDEAAYGGEHPNVAIDLNNLAQLLKDTNRLAEAEPLMRRAFAIDEAAYGAEHPNVARHLNNLAQLLQATNRLADAEPLMRRALAIDEAAYGTEHPNVARDLNNLALLLKDTNRLADALPLFKRAVNIFRVSYGEDHPHTQTVAMNYYLALKAAEGNGQDS